MKATATLAAALRTGDGRRYISEGHADLDGSACSVIKVLERLDAGVVGDRPARLAVTYGNVAVLGIVGNEDGAHHVTAEVFEALNDVGFTIPAAGGAYWVGEAMQKANYDQAGPTRHPRRHTKTLAANAAHLARLLKELRIPAFLRATLRAPIPSSAPHAARKPNLSAMAIAPMPRTHRCAVWRSRTRLADVCTGQAGRASMSSAPTVRLSSAAAA